MASWVGQYEHRLSSLEWTSDDRILKEMKRANSHATLGWLVPLLLACLCFIAYVQLPGRSSQSVRVEIDEPDRPPDPDGNFSIGPLRWDVATYRTAASLAPFRALYAQHCAGTRGLAAATCVSDVFAKAFKHGGPTREFVQSEYDPPRDLAAHLGGEPGHCVTRSGLLATTLLSEGIPARQVQVVTAGLGHNLITVWDQQHGWVAFDPSSGTVFEQEGKLASTVGAMTREGGDVRSIALAPMDQVYFTSAKQLREGGAAPEIMYPEPWLYTRVGNHVAQWPFRGLFVHTGAAHWNLGSAQTALRWGMLACLLLAVLGLAGSRQKPDFFKQVARPSRAPALRGG